MRTPAPLAVSLAAALALALAGCGSDDNASQDTRPPACEDLIGETVVDGMFDTGCLADDGGLRYYGAAFHDCVDGGRLLWNDLGWGHTGQPFQPHTRPDGQLVPPDPALDACKP